MSHFFDPRDRVLRAKADATGGGARPVTAAERVPISRRFAQSHQRLEQKGWAVTLPLLLPKSAGLRGERAGVHAPPCVPRTNPPRGAPSSSSRDDAVRTSSRSSSASQRRRASACTNRDIRNSGDAAALAWASFIDGRRDRPPPRIFRPDRGYAAAVRLREWISKPPRGGSRSGRRQSGDAGPRTSLSG